MANLSKGIIQKGHLIDGKYNVLFFIKGSTYTESYRVKDNNGKLGFLKLFNYGKLTCGLIILVMICSPGLRFSSGLKFATTFIPWSNGLFNISIKS